MSELTEQQREALDYLVDMARGHDYAEVAKISAAEDVLLDAFADRARMLTDAKAEALREAAETMPSGWGNPFWANWLRDRAEASGREGER